MHCRLGIRDKGKILQRFRRVDTKYTLRRENNYRR